MNSLRYWLLILLCTFFVACNKDNEPPPEPELEPVDYPKAEGTFIQDWLVSNWDDARWQEEFRVLKGAGMSYLVLAPTLNVDQQGKYYTIYPSKILNAEQRYKNDIVDICLQNAQKAGFKVFLGLNMNEG